MTVEATAQQALPPSAHDSPSSSRAVERLDRAIARLLRVQPQPLDPDSTNGGRPFETPLLVAGLRCTLRYVVLPFMVPLLGVATGATRGIVTGAALGLLLTMDVIAAVAIVATLRRLWALRHPRRWQYLAVALVLSVLVGFFFMSDAYVVFS